MLVAGCAIDPIIEKEEPTPQYKGEYCEYRDLGNTFIKDCLSIEMIFTDQMAFYRIFVKNPLDSTICEARVSFILEDRMYFDSASTIFLPDCLTKIYFSGEYDFQLSEDSLSFGRFDDQTGIGCYVNMERLD